MADTETLCEKDNNCGSPAEKARKDLADIKLQNANGSVDAKVLNQLDTVQKYLEQIDLKFSSQQDDTLSEIEDINKMAPAKKMEENLNLVIRQYENASPQLARWNAVAIEARDTLQKHLSNIETQFFYAHEKYERCKEVLTNFKNNEIILRESITKKEEEIFRLNSENEALRTHALRQSAKSKHELLHYKRRFKVEISRLKATNQILESQLSSLKVKVEQRTLECEKLWRASGAI